MLTSKEIIIAVAAEFDCEERQIIGSRRDAAMVLPRRTAMFLCRKLLHISYPETARIFVRDHSTVMQACRNVMDHIERTPRFRLKVQSIVDKLLKTVPPEIPDCLGCLRREQQLVELRTLLSAAATVAK